MRISTRQARWDESGDSTINIPANVASTKEVEAINTTRKIVAVVRDISNSMVRWSTREGHPRTRGYFCWSFWSKYTLSRNPDTIDRDEVVVKELGCNSQGVEIA
jgi:hypothetical protein